MANRKEILEKAIQTICHDRQDQYGSPENNFESIAQFWNDYLLFKHNQAPDITAEDVGIMMVLFKIARMSTGVIKDDNYVDAAGYIGCAGEIALRREHERCTARNLEYADNPATN